MCGSRCGVSKTTLWISWTIATVLAVVYGALSLKTFARVDTVYAESEEPDSQIRAVLVTTFSGPVVVVSFTALSLLLMLSKQISSKGVGFSYGFVNASALMMSLFSFLCGMVLFTFEDDIASVFSKGSEGTWKDTDTKVLKSTYAFAFVATVGYFVLFLVMFFASFTIERQHSLLEEEDA